MIISLIVILPYVRFLGGKMYMAGMGSNGEDFFDDYPLYCTYLFIQCLNSGQGKNQGKFSRSFLVIKFQF